MIEAANHLPYNPQETNYTKITQEEIQREVDYWRAYKILQKMLKAGLISEEEFDKISGGAQLVHERLVQAGHDFHIHDHIF